MHSICKRSATPPKSDQMGLRAAVLRARVFLQCAKIAQLHHEHCIEALTRRERQSAVWACYRNKASTNRFQGLGRNGSSSSTRTRHCHTAKFPKTWFPKRWCAAPCVKIRMLYEVACLAKRKQNLECLLHNESSRSCFSCFSCVKKN
jgi:hypothetical protein